MYDIYLVLIIISIIASTPILKYFYSKIKETKYKNLVQILEVICYMILLTLTTAYLIDESFNPFLYFRF